MDKSNEHIYIPTTYRNDLFFQISKTSEHTLSIHHNHNFLQLWYVTRGSFRHIIAGKEYTHSEGELLILPPYVFHQLDTRNSKNIEWFFLNAADNFLNTFPEGMTKNTLFNMICLRPLMYSYNNADPFLRFSGDSAKKLVGMLTNLLEEYETPTDNSPGNIRSDFAYLLTFIAEKYTSSMPSGDNAVYSHYRAGLQSAFDFIESNYTRQIKIDDVCRVALLSRTSLTYIFRQLTGKSVVEYVNSLRIRTAKKLLAEKKSVTDVCHECGFNDITHFCRIFKKTVGCTPREFAKPQL